MSYTADRSDPPATRSKAARAIDEVLPRSAALIEVFRSDDDTNRGPCGHELLGIAARLAAQHGRQWDAEDVCRDPRIDTHVLAETKETIDILNARRVRMVGDIDARVAVLVAARPAAALHTETLGSVIDRLAIAWVRSGRLVHACTTERREPARHALRQLAELADAYDDLVRDVLAGRRRLPNWRVPKSYGGDR